MKRINLVWMMVLLLPLSEATMLSEVLYDPSGDERSDEFVEVAGRGNLSGCIIGDSANNDTLTLKRIGSAPIALITSDTYNATIGEAWHYSAGARIGNGLANSGDAVRLYCNATLTDQMRYEDGDAEEGHSLVRTADGWEQGEPTPGRIETDEANTDTTNTTLANVSDEQPREIITRACPKTPCGWGWRIASERIREDAWEVWVERSPETTHEPLRWNAEVHQGNRTEHIEWSGEEHRLITIEQDAQLIVTAARESCTPESRSAWLPGPEHASIVAEQTSKPPSTHLLSWRRSAAPDEPIDAHLLILSDTPIRARVHSVLRNAHGTPQGLPDRRTIDVDTFAVLELIHHAPVPGNYTLTINVTTPEHTWAESAAVDVSRAPACPEADAHEEAVYTSPISRARNWAPLAVGSLATSAALIGLAKWYLSRNNYIRTEGLNKHEP